MHKIHQIFFGAPKEENEDNRHILEDTIRNKTSGKKKKTFEAEYSSGRYVQGKLN